MMLKTSFNRNMMLMMLKTLFNRKEANELCSKFGSDVFMAGEINNQLDFDEYYKVEVSFLTINKSLSAMARFYQHSYSACKKLNICPVFALHLELFFSSFPQGFDQ